MGQITTRRHLSRNEREMVRAVTSQIRNIDQAAAIVKGAINEVGHLHATAARIASSQVQITEQDMSAAARNGRLSPGMEYEVRRLTGEFLEELLSVTDQTDFEIVKLLAKF